MVCLASKLLILFLLSQSPDSLSSPYPAHAHNDYMHERPLFDALENGFRSIEADVFSVGDSLYVAHDRKDIMPGRTLRNLYLEPLMEYMAGRGQSTYDSVIPLILLVDIKDIGLGTYKLLDLILCDFREILCHLTPGEHVRGSVMVVVSGNRPVEYMKKQTMRHAFVDGRIKDLEDEYTPLLMPLISDRWGKYFSWSGGGEMPEEEREQLRSYIQRAHASGQLVRFWATPDAPGREREAVWTELLEAGVDLINTDDLSGLRAFLSAYGE